MSDERVNFILSAQDRASATVKRLKGELGAMGGTAGAAAGPLGRLSAVTGGMVSPMTLGIGAAAGLGAALLGTVQGASDLNEEIDKSRVVFGPASDEMIEFARGASRIGLSTQAALGAAGAFGNMFHTVGLSQGVSEDMSETMVQLAADMGSFNNIDPTEMLDKLRSGLTGEAEPLRQYGVLISEAAVKTFAYANGIADAGSALTEAQKVQARYGLILENTTIQQGNFADTSGSLANLQRTLGAEFADLSTEIGQVLLPVMQAAVSWVLHDFIPAIRAFANEISPIVEGLGILVGAVGGFGNAAEEVAAKVEADMTAMAEIAAMRVGDMTAAMQEGLQRGGPVIAAEAGRIAGMLPSEISRRVADIRAAGRNNVVEFAAGMLDAQNSPMLAMEALQRAQETALTRGEEIARLKGQLTGAALAGGLNDARVEVRGVAAAARLDITSRLEFLNVDASNWGVNIGNALAAGLNSQYGVVRTAAGGLAAAVRGQIGIRSEPRDPSSPLFGVTQWGGNIATTMAKGMRGKLGVARDAAGLLGGALMPSFGGAMAPAYAGGGFGAGGAVIELHVHSYLDGREVAENVTRHQHYQHPAGTSILPRGS